MTVADVICLYLLFLLHTFPLSPLSCPPVFPHILLLLGSLSTSTVPTMHHSLRDPPLEAARPPLVVMSKFRSNRKKRSRSHSHISDTPFGPPHIPSTPKAGISRIRNTLWKFSPAARAEKEILKQKTAFRYPLTERNVETFVSKQEVMGVLQPADNSTELHVTAWLEQLS